MKQAHQVTINDLKYRLRHVEQQESTLKTQRDTLYQQYLEVEDKLRHVQAERGELTRAIKAISSVVLPAKSAHEEYNDHDKH